MAVISKTWTLLAPPSLTQTSRSSGVQAMPCPSVPEANGTWSTTRPVVRSATSNPLYPTTSLTTRVPLPLTEKGASWPEQQYPLTVRATRLLEVSTTYIAWVSDLVSMYARLPSRLTIVSWLRGGSDTRATSAPVRPST